MAEKHLQLKKPSRSTAPPPGSEEAIKALIERGGSAPKANEVEQFASPKRKSVIVYFTPDVLDRVDRACANARILTPRQRWIMEAILEKLDREEGQQ
jgi:hypothetical protein